MDRNADQNGETNGVGEHASNKKIKLGGFEKELREWTLFELFDGLSKVSAKDEDALFEIIYEIKKRLDGPSGLQIILSDQVKPFLAGGLTAALPAVRELTLSQLGRAASAGAPGVALLTEVWPALVKSLADENLRVASAAVSALLAVGQEPAGRALLFDSPASHELFQAMLAQNEVLRLRVLDLFVELAVKSPELLNRSRPYVDLLFRELPSRDLLHRMNVLELLEKLAKTEHGAAYVQQQAGVTADLQRLLTDSDDPGFSLLCGSALRLLASVARQPSAAGPGAFSTLLPVVEQLLESRDESCAEAAISFVGALGSSPAGAEVLLNQRPLLRSWFEHMTSTSALLRLSCLHAFAELLQCPDEAKTQAVFEVEDRGWDGASSGEVIRALMRFIEQPFADLRYAAFRVMQALGRHAWGVRALFAAPGFLEFLINRTTETTKEGHEWKYAIVDAVAGPHAVATNNARETLGEARFELLTAYLAQGVHYVRGEMATKIASKSG